MRGGGYSGISKSQAQAWDRAISKAQKIAHKRGVTVCFNAQCERVLCDLKGNEVKEYNDLLNGFCVDVNEAFKAITMSNGKCSPPYDDRGLHSIKGAFEW